MAMIMNYLRNMIKKSPVLSLCLFVTLIAGITLIIGGNLSGQNQPTNYGARVLPCHSSSCPQSIVFGPWRPRYGLVFANSEGWVDYEFGVLRCRKISKKEDIFVRSYFVQIGKFKKNIRVGRLGLRGLSYECEMSDKTLIDTKSFIERPPKKGHLYTGIKNDRPSQYEIL